MNSHIRFDKLPELASRLNLWFRSGHISLEQERMVLLHTGALGSLRRELIETLGIERARGVLTRMGFASGERDAEMVRQLMPEASDDELMSLGPQMHSLEGIVHVTPITFDIDVARGEFYGEFGWDGSYEAEVHLEHFGLHHEAVCWAQVGYACGYTSGVLGRFVVYREVECRGKGDNWCKIVGRPVDDWGEEIEPELRYFEPESLADQIVSLQNQVEHLRYSIDDQVNLGDMVGVSEAFRQTGEMIRKAADSFVTVLLLGETGVGKEMFARGLHQLSTRAEKAFVAVNCAAMPEELIESELFGVEKGAFTGAQQSRPGRFERAHGGTLFLDEVAELRPSAQAKLLRVLQNGEFERVGDTSTRKVDVRLIAATNVDLQQAVREGRFRADLYYRLSVYPVLVPPLRERREDIPLLVQRFLDRYGARHGKRIRGITENALAALQSYDWPGNVRELENMIERGVILASSDECIELRHLFPSVNIKSLQPTAPSPPPGVPAEGLAPGPGAGNHSGSGDTLDTAVDSVLDSDASLGELECRLLETAVERADGNLSKAARLLGMTRAQLAYRLKKHQARE